MLSYIGILLSMKTMRCCTNPALEKGSFITATKGFLCGLLLFALGCATLPVTSLTDDDTPLSGEVVLTVYGLSCPLCASNVDQQLNRLPGIVEMYPDLDTGAIRITLEEGHTLPVSAFARAIEDAGFTLRSAELAGEDP